MSLGDGDMMFDLNKSIVKVESNNKVLLFNPHNLELLITSKSKYNSSMSKKDISILDNLNMLSNNETNRYNISEFYPNHIAKAYILFGTNCNLVCSYCTVQYCAEKYGLNCSMTESTLYATLDFLFFENTKLEHITLYGGEPLLHKDRIIQFFDYLDILPTEKIPRIDIITNGTIIDNDIMQLLKKWDVLVIVSLDGTEKIHDCFRKDIYGNGTYHNVIRGVQEYQKNGVRVGVSAVLGKHNYKDINYFCEDLKRKYNIVSIGLTLPHMQPDVAFSNDFQTYLKNCYHEILSVCQKQQLWFEQGMKRLLALARKQYYIYGCPTTTNGCMIRILPAGEITLCENMGLRGLFQLGNVNDRTSLNFLFNNKEFKRWYSRCTNQDIKCYNCKGYAICGRGCPYDAYLQSGSIDSSEIRNCYIIKQAVDWYLGRVIDKISLSSLDEIKILNIDEREAILVNCPW